MMRIKIVEIIVDGRRFTALQPGGAPAVSELIINGALFQAENSGGGISEALLATPGRDCRQMVVIGKLI
ncbi:MAG: hypothetical protein UV36_C0033G0002 [Parcubacteria group bacterium GW2011_GWC2_42_6]|nr:MAG: hypothetical protein UU87_C0004G0014 [Parcubacteria group bacterium GW2011_GWA2_42_11]KKS66209.1 MAG: hypothetical protein UV36_C0033G0002 [Parcubacteria group bacterium GW2011_GWC2_42_6]KKT76596.1 MAG: hypothetical protein UW72_C0004G0017 [Parcubacteria group bacterium GW2011_GWF2_44_7]